MRMPIKVSLLLMCYAALAYGGDDPKFAVELGDRYNTTRDVVATWNAVNCSSSGSPVYRISYIEEYEDGPLMYSYPTSTTFTIPNLEFWSAVNVHLSVICEKYFQSYESSLLITDDEVPDLEDVIIEAGATKVDIIIKGNRRVSKVLLHYELRYCVLDVGHCLPERAERPYRGQMVRVRISKLVPSTNYELTIVAVIANKYGRSGTYRSTPHTVRFTTVSPEAEANLNAILGKNHGDSVDVLVSWRSGICEAYADSTTDYEVAYVVGNGTLTEAGRTQDNKFLLSKMEFGTNLTILLRKVCLRYNTEAKTYIIIPGPPKPAANIDTVPLSDSSDWKQPQNNDVSQYFTTLHLFEN